MKIFSCLKSWIFSLEDWRLLLYCLKVLYRCVRMKFFFRKKLIFFQLKFLNFLVIKNLDLDPDSSESLDPESVNMDPEHCSVDNILLISKLFIVYEEYDD